MLSRVSQHAHASSALRCCLPTMAATSSRAFGALSSSSSLDGTNKGRNNCSNGPRLVASTALSAGQLHLIRQLSTKDVFLQPFPADLLDQIPALPQSPGSSFVPISELVAAGKSVLEELGLWAWWKPSSWLRWALELTHIHTDLPWWGTIVVFTAVFRLCLIFVPIRIQRNNGIQRQYMPQLKVFNERIQEARAEGDFLRVQQITLEQRHFFKQKGLSSLAIFPYLAINTACFTSLFFALRNLAMANYPGFNKGGILWFTDLTVTDPYWALPLLTAASLHLVVRTGIDTGNADTMAPIMRTMMLYGFPFFVFIATGYFPAGQCVYWFTTNSMSLLFALLFKQPHIRKLLKLPEPPAKQSSAQPKRGVFSEIQKLLSGPQSPPSLAETRKQDMQQFVRAGQIRPVVRVPQQKQQEGEGGGGGEAADGQQQSGKGGA